MPQNQAVKFPISTKEFQHLTHKETKESSVTTTWGVDWDDDMIARDLMQNFYDANQNAVDEIQTTRRGSQVTLLAPAEFDLQNLFYFASEKGDEDVGQYGEGFKAATVCLLRQYPDAIVVATSGEDVVWVRLGQRSLQKTNIQPMVYEYFSTSKSFSGSRLIVRGASKTFADALCTALNQFYYSGNAIIGEKLCGDWDKK